MQNPQENFYHVVNTDPSLDEFFKNNSIKLRTSGHFEASFEKWRNTPAKHRKPCSPYVVFSPEKDQIWDSNISPKLFELDFLSGKLNYRVCRASNDASPLRKSLPQKRPVESKLIWDLCGGWGEDGLMMALWSHNVVSYESSPVVHLLAQRALEKFTHQQAPDIKIKRMHAKAEDALAKANQKPEVIYLDPMYPQTKSKALNQSEMRYLKPLANNSDNALRLLETSLNVATESVILKRPIKAEILLQSPTRSIEQGSTRYDIYNL